MDIETIRNHFKTLFASSVDHEKRITKLEVRQEDIKDAQNAHSDKIEEHGANISTIATWIGRIGVGGAVILFIADKLGWFDILKG